MLVKRERLEVRVPSGSERSIWDALHQDFGGYVNEVKEGYWKALNMGFSQSDVPIPGDLFFGDDGSVLYYSIDTGRSYIEAGCLFPNGGGDDRFSRFCQRIRQTILPLGKGPTWHEHCPPNSAFELVREEAQGFVPSDEQLSSAAALSQVSRMNLLRKINGQRNCLLDTLAEGKTLLEVGQEVQLLESLGLISRDLVVFCREAGNQISRVNSFSQIEEATKRGFKCFSCGRPIAEERIDQLLATTPQGAQLAGPNYWLGLVLSHSLETMGIAAAQQLVVTLPPPAQPGAAVAEHSVLDLFANYQGLLLMFEVREALPEKAVGLDDVFLFLSRVRYYSPDLAFYLTTQPLSREVSAYLAQPMGTPIMLLESPGGVEEQVKAVVARCQRERMRDVVERLIPSTSVDICTLVYEYFFGPEEKPEPPPPPPLEEEVPQDGRAASLPPRQSLEERLQPEEPLVKPFDPLETMELSMESLLEPLQITSEAPPEKPPQEKVPQNNAPQEKAPPPLDEPPAPQMPDIPEMPFAASPFSLSDMPPFPDLDLPSLSSVGLQMQEELVGSEPLIAEELLPFETATEKPLEEERESVLRRVTEEIAADGIVGREDELLHLLSQINSTPEMTSALVDDSGLLLVDTLSSKVPSELVAALCWDIGENIQRSFDELGSGRVHAIHAESNADRLQMRPAGDKALLVVREERPHRDIDEETAGTLPGEMVLREAMLKKVLEDLSMVEGVRGTIVAGRDGLLIEATLLTEEVPAEVMSAVISQMLVDNEKALQRLLLHPIRQLLLRTADDLISLVPLDKEGILITQLDIATPREVWQSHLFGAANMLVSVFQ